MKLLSEKNIIMGSVLIFFTLVAILFLVTGSEKNRENKTSVSPFESPSDIPVQFIPQNGSPMEVKEKIENNTVIRYADGAFTPHDVSIKNKTGCFVEIQNADHLIITPRLGPYDPQKERGFLYPPIAPGKTSLIDPRYGSGTTYSFYEKSKTTADFIVHIDPTCL